MRFKSFKIKKGKNTDGKLKTNFSLIWEINSSWNGSSLLFGDLYPSRYFWKHQQALDIGFLLYLALKQHKINSLRGLPFFGENLKNIFKLERHVGQKKNENNFKLRYPRVCTPIDHSHWPIAWRLVYIGNWSSIGKWGYLSLKCC